MQIMEILERLIQDIALRFHEPNHMPLRLKRQHARLAKWVRFCTSNKRYLLQLALDRPKFDVRLSITAKGYD